MGAPVIWSGAYGKLLASLGFLFKNGLTFLTGSANPSAVATTAAKGSLYMSDLGRLYQKQDAGSSENWLSIDFTKAQSIEVAKSGGQYTAIQDAVNAITDATPTKPYIVDVYPGIYVGDVVLKDDVYLRGRVFGDMPAVVIEGQVTGTCASASSSMGMFNITTRHTPTAGKREAIALVGPGALNLASVSAYFVGAGDFAASCIKLTGIVSGCGMNSVTAYDFRTGGVTADSVGVEFDGSGPLLLDGVRSTVAHSRASGISTGFKCSTTGNVSAFGCFALFSNLAASFSGEVIGVDYPVAQTAGRVRNTTEFFARFTNTAGACVATMFKGSGSGNKIQHVKSTLYSVGFPTNQINSVDANTSHFLPNLSSNVLVTKTGNGLTTITPSDNVISGFVEWGSASATYWSYVASTRTFTVDKRGSGLIKGTPVEWTGGQSVVLTDYAVNYVYMDSFGVIQTTTSTTLGTLYRENIVLFQVWVEGGRIVTCKENHPAEYPTAVSIQQHLGFKGFLENADSTLTVTTASSRQINFLGENTILDHGIQATVPATSPVTWNIVGRRRSDGKAYSLGTPVSAIPTLYDTSLTSTIVNAGSFVVGRSYEILVPGSTDFTLIGAANNSAGTCFTATGVGTGSGTAYRLTDDATNGDWFVFRLGVLKESLNTTTPTFVCCLHTAVFGSQTAARNAIAAGTIIAFPQELKDLEIVRLGYGIIQGNGTAGSGASGAVAPVTELQVQGAVFASGGSSTAASLVLMDTSTFNGQLTGTESNAQAVASRLDDYGYIPAWVATTGEYRIGNVVKQYDGIYRCTTAHTASAAFATDILNWEQLSIPKFATVVAAEAATGLQDSLMYCLETESFYRYEASGSGYVANSFSILNALEGGDTRWLAIAGQYNVNQILPPYETLLSIAAGDSINPNLFPPNAPEVLIAVGGDALGQNAMNAFPFTSSAPVYCRRISLVGTDNAYTVTMASNDDQNGAWISGGFIEIGRGTHIVFEYSAVLERWVEVCRNNYTNPDITA